MDTGTLAIDLHNKLLEMKKVMSDVLFGVASILKEIKDKRLYELLGYESFGEYVQSPDIGINMRTAYYYIEIYETFILKLSYKPEDLREFSYDKLRKLLPTVRSIEPIEGKIQKVMDDARVLRWYDFNKQYKDDSKNVDFKEYLPAPEYYRCQCHGKWIISVPIDECCDNYLVDLYAILKKRFDNNKKGL